MELNEKLQELRKQKGITQEELAQSLYVSRTAVSKWESGRGYPNIESLKNIAKFFSVTVDELLSGDELLTIAENDHKQKERHFCDMVFGLLDIGSLMLFFLPLFGQRSGGTIKAVSLLDLTYISAYLQIFSFAVIVAIAFVGVLLLAMQNCRFGVWERFKNKISLILNAFSVLLFIVSSQPYAATLLFVFLIIKVLINKA